MKEIDWSKAPEGATHWEPAHVGVVASWMKLENNQWSFWPAEDAVSERRWYKADHIKNARAERMIPRPTAWNGTGLPPVGTVCEVLWNESRLEYLKAKVFGVNEHGQPIFRFEEGPKKFEYQADPLLTASGASVFRPILTPEQIAEEEREKAIAAMLDLFKRAACKQTYDMKAGIAAIYDDGFRKVEGGAE